MSTRLKPVPSPWCRRLRGNGQGFTLMEVLIVMALVALLASLALPRYFGSLTAARETVLRENLRLTREAIGRFHDDQGRYPASLEELVTQRYLRELPLDPVLERRDAWVLVPPTPPDRGAVADIFSGATGTTRDGRALAGL